VGSTHHPKKQPASPLIRELHSLGDGLIALPSVSSARMTRGSRAWQNSLDAPVSRGRRNS
jgi:hypothetical protein